MILSDNERLGAALVVLLRHLKPDGAIELGRNWAGEWRVTYESLGEPYTRTTGTVVPRATALADALEKLASLRESREAK